MDSFSAAHTRPPQHHRGRGTFKNRTWVAGERSGSSSPFQAQNGHLGADAPRWERGGGRGGRGRGKGRSPKPEFGSSQQRNGGEVSEVEGEGDDAEVVAAVDGAGAEPGPSDEPVLDTLEERERFYQELVRAREAEKKWAIAEGKMDDPLVPKRLDEAITMVGTCMDMCPRFERYRRERENNLFNWEVIPGTKRVDHKRAVKMYERAAGDKTIPSDLRPPPVLKGIGSGQRTLDYLFRELLQKGGFSPTFDFIRDRSRSVRNDFTMQHDTGPLAIECHERCARFHILALHFERDRPGFSIAMEEQQLMNTLQSLKEFYEDQRDRYESPNELEMRIYHRLIHIRDQRERHDDIPPAILSHPVFLLTTKFRQLVQAKSSPITKTSVLKVDEEGMHQFSGLAAMLREQGSRVMVYLVACILERLFGKDTIDDIEAIRAGISVPDIIDGMLTDDDGAVAADVEVNDYDDEEAFLREDQPIMEEERDEPAVSQHQPQPLKPSATEWLTGNFGVRPSPSVMLAPVSAFGAPSIPAPDAAQAAPSSANSVPPAASAFANLKTTPNVFGGNRGFGSSSAFGGGSPAASAFFGQTSSTSAFGSTSSSTSTSSVPRASGSTADVLSNLRDSGNPSFSPFGASTSAPVVSNFGDQAKATSVFGSSPFAKSTSTSTPSASPTPAAAVDAPSSSSSIFAASQSAPSGFPDNVNLNAGSIPPISTAAASEHQTSVTVPNLNPRAQAFSPGQPFGTPSSTTSVQAETKPTAKIFGSSSSSTTPTRPILTPINTSPHTSVPSSRRASANFTTSQSAPSLNGSTKYPPPERQPTIVDGFRPSVRPGDGSSEASTTPQNPPPLKVQPISLPGTPTGTSFSPPTKQKSSNNLFGWPSVQSFSESEILSPLFMSAKNSLASLPSPPVSARPSLSKFPSVADLPTPTTRQPGPSQPTGADPLPSPKAAATSGASLPSPQDVEMASPTAAPMRNGKNKGKGKAPVVDPEELEARASAFARTSAVVRGALKRWVAKSSERVLYNDAVRRSDAYTGQKTKRRQEVPTQVDAEQPEVKRTARMRVRRRVSAKYVPPQTDAELARRLKENHEQHERRWAPGTFLATLRAHVGNPAPFDYCLWLSLNPENDGTAIWVERKFDMPNDGAWVSERVFSIPLAAGAASRSPGLVVFECTPLHGVDDEIERKYRVLDDCARLREVIETFPEDRHFIPSVLFILWNEDDSETLPDDLRHMTGRRLRSERHHGILRDILSIIKTKDLDEKFGQVLSSMELDTVGGLVEIMSRQEYLQMIIGPWKDFASDWVTRCSSTESDGIGLGSFSKVFEVLVKLMNTLSRHFTTRLDESAVSNPLPEIRLDGAKSSSELYDATFGWLEHKDLRTPSREFRMMLQSYRTPNADFPVHASVSALYDLSVRCIEGSVRIDRAVRYPVPKRDIEETRREVEGDVAEAGTQLCSVLVFHSRPKRPPPDEDEEASVLSMSPSSKRLKSTFSSFSTVDDLALSNSSELMPPPSTAVSPSTSVTTIVNEERPGKVVTVAMLRALTASVLKR
ncbi:SAC3/GANP/Nin1/mts3/eIF-3 p25 family-domain-containing protein [Russula vinacea]|nr:SAC3/GANP/Nin1/mts3/eIF-3 p25 family-domain-containing protein [Russula vinacea]